MEVEHKTYIDNTVTAKNMFANQGSIYDKESSKMKVAYGLYWFHLSVGLTARKSADVSLTEDGGNFNFSRVFVSDNNNHVSSDVANRDFLIAMPNEGSSSNKQFTAVMEDSYYSDTLSQTGWLAFKLEEMLNPLAVVRLITTWTAEGRSGPIRLASPEVFLGL